ncbi:hypothetical protein LSCM1_04921 [Leishmania martiniquensis]|uniref:Uncharacterized protein n=1 Tax=Leishmania martiniquensis TaxID=1580590 RepID=A0A836HVK6_9TRYP|nr:hypothetical protein LSCM1_04921 [Leishmania martiniquensis]
MRARILRAGRTEQQQYAEKELNARIDDLLHTLAHHIVACAPQWAAQVRARSRKESIGHASGAAALAWEGWRDAELAHVLSTMTEMQELVDLHVVRHLDAAAATLSGDDSTGDSSRAVAAPVSEASAASALSTDFYAEFVRLLIARIFIIVTENALSFSGSPAYVQDVRTAAGPAKGDAVIVACFAPNNSTSLLPAQSMLRLPASIYIGWRCGYRLLSSIGDMLRLADGDRAAGWLDVTSAALRSVWDGAHACSGSFSAASAPDAAEALRRFVVGAETHVHALQCMWWWCSLVFEHCYAHGWLITCTSAPSPNSAQSAPESREEASCNSRIAIAAASGACARSDGAAQLIFSPEGGDYRKLWDVGRSKVTEYLSGIALPAVADFLRAALERFVFVDAVSSAPPWPNQSEQLTKALQAVRSAAVGLFPSPPLSVDASSSEKLSSCPAALSTSASSFLRHVVHAALLPLAERVLDDGSAALPGPIAPTPGRASNAAAAPASATEDGGGRSSDEEEWEELQLAGGASRCPTGVEVAATVEASATARKSAIIFALDELERGFGELARDDSVAMTLRRL